MKENNIQFVYCENGKPAGDLVEHKRRILLDC